MPPGVWLWSVWVGRAVARGAGSPCRVEDQLADQLPGVAVDDADVQVVDEQGDGGAGKSADNPMLRAGPSGSSS